MFCKLRQNILVNIIIIVIRTDVSKIYLTYTHNSTKVKLTIFFIKWMTNLVLFHLQTDEQILIIKHVGEKFTIIIIIIIPTDALKFNIINTHNSTAVKMKIFIIYKNR